MSQSKVKDSQNYPEGWDEEIVQAFLENPRTCVYCGFRATSYLAWCQLVLDHFIPKRVGGGASRRNYVVSCYRCNQWKGRYDPGDGRYTYLQRGKKQRKELIEKAKAFIRASKERQGRRELYNFIKPRIREARTQREKQGVTGNGTRHSACRLATFHSSFVTVFASGCRFARALEDAPHRNDQNAHLCATSLRHHA